jgi:hypothetical protein
MSRSRELRDPIHGFIQRSELEQKLIDTSVFQRLRGIKQLAMANLVYPGALHTRFDHSIGVMHVAGRMAEKLIDDKEIVRLISLTALLHDIGHGPFSHVSEDLLDKYYDKSKITPKSKEKIHEKLTCQIIEQNEEIGKLLSPEEKKKMVALLCGTQEESLVRGIISGPLDADKLDYLLRDSYFCGVKYGIYDLERLIGTLESHPEGQDRLLAATYDGVYAIEQFVLAKYHLSTQVYRHKIRLITDAMIVRALELGIEKDKFDWLIKLYNYDGSDNHLNYFLGWDDGRLIDKLLFSSRTKGLASDLFLRLKERRLFKRVFTRLMGEIPRPRARKFLSDINKKQDFKKEMEKRLAETLSSSFSFSIKPEHVIICSFSIKSVREESRNNEGSIIILKDGQPGRLEDESTLFRSIDERQNDQYLEVYAPVTFKDDLDKRRKKAEMSEKILDILQNGALETLRNKRKNGKRGKQP